MLLDDLYNQHYLRESREDKFGKPDTPEYWEKKHEDHANFLKLIDYLPSNLLKLISTNFINGESAFFKSASNLNEPYQSIDKGEYQKFKALNDYFTMSKGLALNVALRNMVKDNIIDKKFIAEANKLLIPQVKTFLKSKKRIASFFSRRSRRNKQGSFS